MMNQPLLAPATAGSPRRTQQFVRLLVDRRVAVSLFLFVPTVAFDVLVLHGPARLQMPLADPFAIACLLAILLGLLIRTWAAGTLHKRERLATTGPYAWSRNPLYVGSFLMMIGFCTLLLTPWLIAAVALPIAAIYALAVRDEERMLARSFPQAWADYAARVPRFLPWRLASPLHGGWSLSQWCANAEYNAWIGAGLGIAALVAIR